MTTPATPAQNGNDTDIAASPTSSIPSPAPERETLYGLFSRVAGARRDAVAVIDGTGASTDTTYGALLARAHGLAAELRGRGVREGSCVGVYLPNWIDSIVWQIAASALGAHVIGINTRYGDAEVEHVLSRARPTVVVVAHDFLGLPLHRRLVSAVEATRRADPYAAAPGIAVITAPGSPAPDAEAVAGYDCGSGAWAPRGEELDALPADLPASTTTDALAVAFTTSGSTGKPKLAAHTSEHVTRHLRGCAASAGLDEDSVSLINLPLSGVLAYVPAYAALAAGGAVVLEPSFSGAESLALMESHAVTHLTCADDIAGKIKDAWAENPVALPAFRMLLFADFYGFSRSIAAWVEDELGAYAVGIFGSSEVFALCTFWRASDERPTRWLPGGHQPDEGIEIRIVDQFDRSPVAPGEPGEIEVRGYPVVDAYLGDDGTEYARNVSPDGWFMTGDQGRTPDPGTLIYMARLSDSLRLKGFLVEPMEIETVLAELPDVAVAKIVGVAADGETKAVAFVSPKEGHTIDPDAVIRHCADRLAKFKVPAMVHVLDEMPMTVGTNGNKIRAAELRTIAAERL